MMFYPVRRRFAPVGLFNYLTVPRDSDIARGSEFYERLFSNFARRDHDENGSYKFSVGDSRPEDVSISLSDDNTKLKVSVNFSDGNSVHSSSFTRVSSSGFDKDKISAELDKGVLTVTAPEIDKDEKEEIEDSPVSIPVSFDDNTKEIGKESSEKDNKREKED